MAIDAPLFRLPRDEQFRARFRDDGYAVVADSLDAQFARYASAMAATMVSTFAQAIDRRGMGHRLAYRVVTGNQIRANAPMLFDLYASATLLEWIRQVTDCSTVSRSPHLQSAVNLNCLTAAGDEYPLHRDALPYTVLLFLSTVTSEAGGDFVIHSLRGKISTIQPTLSQLVLMDGSRCAHGVLPLRRDAWRLTMPMVFPRELQPRPAGLDEYLYRTP